MTEELITEARKRIAYFGFEGAPSLTERLTDALEAVTAERDATIREMHARELHHFEAEQAMREALELIQPGRFMRPDEPGYAGTTRDVVRARRILSAALNEGNTEA